MTLMIKQEITSMTAGLNKKQKIRIIANEIVVYTTVGKYGNVLGTTWVIDAVDKALKAIYNSSRSKLPFRGILTSEFCPISGKTIQVDIL